MTKLQNQTPMLMTSAIHRLKAAPLRTLHRILLTAGLVAAAACTVANPIHRRDAGDNSEAGDMSDTGEMTDASGTSNPGEKLSSVTCQPNLAYHARLTARSSADDPILGWDEPMAVDGKTTSSDGSYGYSSVVGNNSNPNQVEWIEIDLGMPRIFDSVVLYPRNDPGHLGDGFPIDFTIKVWSGTEWVTRVTQKNYPRPDRNPQVFTWGSRSMGSKILIEATNLRTADSWYVLQFAEIQVSDSMSELNPDSNQLLGVRVTAGSWHEDQISYGWTPANVVDGQTAVPHAGYSSSLYNQTKTVFDPHTEWLEFSLPCRKTLSKIVLYPRNHRGYIDNGFPEDFSISLWSGTDWDKKVNETGYKLPEGAAQTFSWGSRYTTDKIRIDATKLRNRENGWYMFQLAEVEAYP